MFLGAHFSNSTADSDFCENICGLADFAKNWHGLADFAKNWHGSTDLLSPIHQPSSHKGEWFPFAKLCCVRFRLSLYPMASRLWTRKLFKIIGNFCGNYYSHTNLLCQSVGFSMHCYYSRWAVVAH